MVSRNVVSVEWHAGHCLLTICIGLFGHSSSGVSLIGQKISLSSNWPHTFSQLFTSETGVALLPGTTMARRRSFIDLQPCAGCVRCRGHGWLCAQHPRCRWPHDDCVGPGVPCDAPGCLADWLARTVKRAPRKTSKRLTPKRLPIH
jgi:hypothetical protein